MWEIKEDADKSMKPGTSDSTPERSKLLGLQQSSDQSYSKTGNVLGVQENSSVKDLRTGYAESAVSTPHPISRAIQAVWWSVTGPFPRPLPATDDEIIRLKQTLVEFYGLADRPDVWLTVCGQMAGLPITKARISYKRLATAGHRLTTNALIKKHKDIEIEKLHARLKQIAEEMAAEPVVPSETHDISGDVQALQELTPGVVSGATTQDGLY